MCAFSIPCFISLSGITRQSFTQNLPKNTYICICHAPTQHSAPAVYTVLNFTALWNAALTLISHRHRMEHFTRLRIRHFGQGKRQETRQTAHRTRKRVGKSEETRQCDRAREREIGWASERQSLRNDSTMSRMTHSLALLDADAISKPRTFNRCRLQRTPRSPHYICTYSTLN